VIKKNNVTGEKAIRKIPVTDCILSSNAMCCEKFNFDPNKILNIYKVGEQIIKVKINKIGSLTADDRG